MLASSTEKFKKSVKNMLQRSLPSRYAPIVVASMGRSGSTLVYKAISEGLASARCGIATYLGKQIFSDTAWDISSTPLHHGVVYKTHALASELPDDTNVKVVFVFGSASDAVISVFACDLRFGPDWTSEHLKNLRASGTLMDSLNYDALRLEEQIDGWLNQRKAQMIALHMDELWNDASKLSEFLGFPVRFPPRKAREGRNFVNPNIQNKIEQLYSDLDRKIASLPKCIIQQ